MAYPEKVLAEDEQVVEHLHPHWITLVPAAVWFLVVCAAAGVCIAFAPDGGTGRTVVLAIVIVVGIVLLCWLSLAPWLRWRTTHYVLTTHRVLIRRGVLRHTGRDISLQRINDVAFSQSIWDRIVKAGTVTIESAGEHGQEDLHNIPRSDHVQQTLNRLIEADGERRARLAYGAAPGFPPRGPAPGEPQPPYPAQVYPAQGYPAQEQPYPTQVYPPGYSPGQSQPSREH